MAKNKERTIRGEDVAISKWFRRWFVFIQSPMADDYRMKCNEPFLSLPGIRQAFIAGSKVVNRVVWQLIGRAGQISGGCNASYHVFLF